MVASDDYTLGVCRNLFDQYWDDSVVFYRQDISCHTKDQVSLPLAAFSFSTILK